MNVDTCYQDFSAGQSPRDLEVRREEEYYRGQPPNCNWVGRWSGMSSVFKVYSSNNSRIAYSSWFCEQLLFEVWRGSATWPLPCCPLPRLQPPPLKLILMRTVFNSILFYSIIFYSILARPWYLFYLRPTDKLLLFTQFKNVWATVNERTFWFLPWILGINM
jgi:hypothetical protein